MAAVKKSRPSFGGNPLRDARTSIRMSQKELAGELGLARTTIVAAEQADPKPWLVLACVGLGCLRLSGVRVGQLTGMRLASLRTQLNLSAAELGRLFGYAESTINTWERTTPPIWTHPAMVGLAVSLTGP